MGIYFFRNFITTQNTLSWLKQLNIWESTWSYTDTKKKRPFYKVLYLLNQKSFQQKKKKKKMFPERLAHIKLQPF